MARTIDGLPVGIVRNTEWRWVVVVVNIVKRYRDHQSSRYFIIHRLVVQVVLLITEEDVKRVGYIGLRELAT